MFVKDIFGLATAIIVLSGLTYAIFHAGQTAQIIGSSATAFTGVVSAATHPG